MVKTSSHSLLGKTKAWTQSDWILPLGVVVVFFLLFSSALPYPFINYDDPMYISENPLVINFSISKIPEIFSTDQGALFAPLVILMHGIEYQFWGLNPLGYRMVNFLLHAGTIFLLFSLLLKLFGSARNAALIVLFFAIHPQRIESIVWISERKDVLFVFLLMLTLNLYHGYLRTQKNKLYLLSLAVLSLAMLAKVSAFVALPLMFMIDWWEHRKIDWRLFLDKIPFMVVILLIGIMGMGYLTTAPHAAFQDFGRVAFNGLGILLFLISRFFLPFDLSIRYSNHVEDLLQPFWLYLAAAILFLALTAWLMRGNRLWRWGALFILIAAMPALGVMWRGHPMTERYTYLPAIGLSLLLVESLGAACTRIRKFKWIGLGVFWGTTGLFLGLIIYAQTNYLFVWREPMSLWNYVIKTYPKTFVAHNNRGVLLYYQGRYEESIRDYDMAINLNPSFEEPWWNRGLSYDKLNMFDKSDMNFWQAIQLNLDYFPKMVYQTNGGFIQNGYRRTLLMGEQLEKQMSRKGHSFFYTMAYLNAKLQRWQKAEDYIEEAVRQDEKNSSYKSLRDKISKRIVR